MILFILFTFPMESTGKDVNDKENQKEQQDKALIVISSMQGCSVQAWAKAEEKTKAEFEALEFTVEVLGCQDISEAKGTTAVFNDLEKIAEDKGAVCAVRILHSENDPGGGVDLWVADRVTKKTTYKHLTSLWEEDDESAAVVALKMVEMLQVSLMELAMPLSKEPRSKPPSPVVEMVETTKLELQAPAPYEPSIELVETNKVKSHGLLGLRLGASAFGSPSSIGAMGALEVGIRWDALPFLSFEAEGIVTPIGKDTKHGQLSLTFSAAAARLWILWEPLRLKRFRLCIGPGGGLLIAWAKGHAPGIGEVRKDNTIAAYAGASLQTALKLAGNLWLRMGFTAGSSMPRISVRYDEKNLISFGMPVLEGFLGVELKLL